MNREPLLPPLMIVFKKSVEEHFSNVAQNFDSKLERVSSQLYGFLTKYALVTIGVYAGHSPSVCVKLRERRPDDNHLVEDEAGMIGTAVLKKFSDPSAPLETHQPITSTTSLDTELKRLAADLSNYGQPFLNNPNANWNGLRMWLAEKIKKNHETTEQKVNPGQPGDYNGIFSVHDSWITMEIVHRFLASGKIERWFPIFECAVPPHLKSVIDSQTNNEHYFEISFKGIPSEKGRFGRAGSCDRDVRILQI